MIDWNIFHDRGYVISDKLFNEEDITSLNEMASKLDPSIGQSKQGWYNYLRLHEERDNGVNILNDIEWSYFWSHTPLDNPIINEKILPVLSEICDLAFDGWDWGWQDTNRYIVQNYPHDESQAGVHPHFDAPYIWPQMPEKQMAKELQEGILSVTFIVPLMNFTVETGATGVVPGTHKFIWDTAKWNDAKDYTTQFFKDNYVQPEVEIGRVACFYGNILHSVMPNQSDMIRRGIIYRGIRQDALDEMKKYELG